METLYERALKKALLMEDVSVTDVTDAIDKHTRIIINYHSKGEDVATGARVIEVYAYGLTKAGNPVIRAFQPFGDTTSRVPSWKFFRLDRISLWKPTAQKFTEPASDNYHGLGEFNPNGDDTMSVVYKVAKFDEEPDDGVFRTDAEKELRKRAERTRQMQSNPIKLSDLTKPAATTQPTAEPKPTATPQPKQPEIYRTDTERGIENLRKQLENPKTIDLSQFNNRGQRKKLPTQQNKANAEYEKLRQQLGDTSGKRMTMADLNRRLTQQPQQQQPTSVQKPVQSQTNSQPDIYRTPTEQGLDRLRQQLDNPRKIDLSKIPKR